MGIETEDKVSAIAVVAAVYDRRCSNRDYARDVRDLVGQHEESCITGLTLFTKHGEIHGNQFLEAFWGR